jgi:hypothetical protein
MARPRESTSSTPLPTDRPWTQVEVAAYLRCSTRTVQRRRVPRIPDTVPPLYEPATVRAWLHKVDLGKGPPMVLS